MERWVFVTILVAFLMVCFVQAFPREAAPTPPSKIESAVNDVIESLQKGLKGIMEDPNLNKLVQDGQKALANAAETIRSEAAKIVPKTE